MKHLDLAAAERHAFRRPQQTVRTGRDRGAMRREKGGHCWGSNVWARRVSEEEASRTTTPGTARRRLAWPTPAGYLPTAARSSGICALLSSKPWAFFCAQAVAQSGQPTTGESVHNFSAFKHGNILQADLSSSSEQNNDSANIPARQCIPTRSSRSNACRRFLAQCPPTRPTPPLLMFLWFFRGVPAPAPAAGETRWVAEACPSS